MKTCPFCAEEIQDAARVCKHCGRDLENPAVTAQQVQIVKPKSRWSGCGTTVVVLFALIVVVGMIGAVLGGPSTTRQEWTAEHQRAVEDALRADNRDLPKSIELSSVGLVVAEWELTPDRVRELSVPMKTFAETRLLLIREALLPYGFTDFRVNVNGTPPGTGLVRRFGSARLIGGGTVEWIAP